MFENDSAEEQGGFTQAFLLGCPMAMAVTMALLLVFLIVDAMILSNFGSGAAVDLSGGETHSIVLTEEATPEAVATEAHGG
ncbi:MAG: hypothetical protein MUF87_20865 [Anaerolineae bacterium]|jgi:hypothetical protein|nr:hypothetical protein [Anaerolineae bacterium]